MLDADSCNSSSKDGVNHEMIFVLSSLKEEEAAVDGFPSQTWMVSIRASVYDVSRHSYPTIDPSSIWRVLSLRFVHSEGKEPLSFISRLVITHTMSNEFVLQASCMQGVQSCQSREGSGM